MLVLCIYTYIYMYMLVSQCSWAVLTCGVSCLYHKLFDNSMKDVSIVVAIASMDTEVLNCLGAAAEE